MRAAITATSRYLPDHIMTNFELEKMVETSDEWIKTRTGITENLLGDIRHGIIEHMVVVN